MPVALLAATIFILSSIPDLPGPPGPYADKWEHTLVFGLLSALIVRAMAGARWDGITARVCSWAVVLTTLYGVSDELHQRFVPGRFADVADVVADAAGAAIAAGLLLAWAIIRRRRQAV